MLAQLSRPVLLSLALLLAATTVSAQQPAPTPGEARAAAAFDAAKQTGPPDLYAFLVPMPKGADLHMHLSGAIYAETFLAEAIKQGLCIDPVAMKFVQPTGPATCATGSVPASDLLKNQHLYDQLIDAFSMRAFVPSEGFNGHDQFFATFGHFSGLSNTMGAWLDEVATRAAAQNEQYLEIMNTPTFDNAASLGAKVLWPLTAPGAATDFASIRKALLAAGLRSEVSTDVQEFAAGATARKAIERCGTPAAVPACGVQIHFLYQILRGYPPQQVFAQTLLGFEVASADPDVVGLNFVMPEDGRISMQDYHLQMQMLDYLHSVYPTVNISLHAGELAPGMVPYEGMSFHIREAINLGHAGRIGHGVDVLYETDPTALLAEMALKHVMVEVNLTSNDVILGIKGKDHPLHAYLAAHVPAALSTDDEGVSRIDLTHEYVTAAEDQGLGYLDLKRMARTSLEHAFLHGQSLWAAPDDFTQRTAVCAAPLVPSGLPPGPCAAFLSANERALQQYELEQRFAAFEAAVH